MRTFRGTSGPYPRLRRLIFIFIKIKYAIKTYHDMATGDCTIQGGSDGVVGPTWHVQPAGVLVIYDALQLPILTSGMMR
jgi:hypothetical protein